MTQPRQIEKWQVDPATAVLHVVRRTRNRPGVDLTESQAQRIADAVLATFDTVVHVEMTAWAELWDKEENMRAHVRRDMRYKLLATVMDQGFVPTALPVEEITRRRVGPFGPDPFGDGKDVVIRLSVPVRVPAVDRAKAVNAGVLTGTEAPPW